MNEPVIRLLAAEDLEGALALSATAGWNQRLADWRMVLSLAPRGSFAALSDRRIVGTSIGIDYGGFGWIAMMLVDPAYRGRGLGRRLLEAAMSALPSDRPIRLDATPLGRPLYQACGFEDEAVLTRHVADGSSRRVAAPPVPHRASSVVRPLSAADLPAIMEHDAEVFGGSRGRVLEWALGDAPLYAHTLESEQGRVHYCFGRHGRLFDQVGPVIAANDEIARALVTAALHASDLRAVVLDVFDSHTGFSAWVRECGFAAQRPLFRMRRPAGQPGPSTQGRSHSSLVEFAILGPEFA
jgi:ribosomal protein S18 acetylase RimI-like enzyme